MKNLIFFLLFSIGYSQNFAPIITNYQKTEYDGESPIWDIAVCENKVVFANNRYIIEYDGNFWNKFSFNNKTIFRSVFEQNNLIYTGSVNNFGYWNYIDGKLKFHSLAEKFKVFKEAEQEEIWKIFSFNNQIYFQSFLNLYVYNGKTVKTYKLPSLASYAYVVDNKLLIATISNGVFEFKNGKFEHLFTIKKDKPLVIHGIEKLNDNLLVATLTDGIFKVNASKVEELNQSLNALLKNHLILKMIKIDNRLIIGTSNNGLYVYDLSNHKIINFNQSQGLISNTIQNIAVDRLNNIWLGTDRGISKVNLGSKTELLYDYSGNIGNVISFDFSNNDIFIGTNHGLYKYNSAHNNINELIQKGVYWNVTTSKNQLFVSDNWGTYSYQNQASKNANINGGNKILNYKNNYLISSFTGIYLFDANNINSYKKISSNFSPIIDFETFDDIIVGSGKNGGLFIYDIKANQSKEILHQNKTIFNPQLVAVNKDKFYVLLKDKKLHQLNIKTKQFTGKILDSKLKNISRIRKIGDDKFLVESDNILYYSIINGNNLIHHLIPKKLYNGMLVDDNLVAKIKDNFLYINLENGILKYDLNEVRNSLPKINIQAKINNEILSSYPKIDYSNNYIDFFISVINDDFLNYQFYYQLNNEPLKVLHSPVLNYKQLKSGDYNLSIYTLFNGEFYKINDFNFRVKKVWYATLPMIIIYIVIILIVVFSFYRYNRLKILQRFRLKQNEHLYELNLLEIKHQQEVNELLHKEEKNNLEENLQSKSTELAAQALRLANQKNFIDEVNQLFAHLEENTKNAQLKKKFERKFTEYSFNTNEWKNFELNIQEIHQDFIKRLSEAYPNLTSKDLKLCVFLRMNLSTKEIAPLLHLNYRSVELQRYRLRKKMKISGDINLSKYMISF